MAGTNERLAVLDGWRDIENGNGIMPYEAVKRDNIPDYLSDWNALKRLEKKARQKGGYTGALLEACRISNPWDIPQTGNASRPFTWEQIHALIATTPEQVAEAILAVLEG